MSSPQGRTKLGQNTDATVAVFRGVFQLRNLILVCEARKILKKTKMYLERHLLPIILSFVKNSIQKREFSLYPVLIVLLCLIFTADYFVNYLEYVIAYHLEI